MTTVDLYDTLSFKEDKSGSIQFDLQPSELNRWRANRCREEMAVPAGRDNLVVRAAELLREFAGIRSGIRIRLTKRIPAAAGLAGGSSDAAATLVALNEIWRLGLSVAELQNLAARLGSDISFFVTSCPAAVCTGRGEVVDPVRISRPLHFLVARPDSGLATAAVYSRCRVPKSPVAVDGIVMAVQSGQLGQIGRHFHNRLQESAESLNDDVVQFSEIFEEMDIPGHAMSGSGTTYFGLCHSRRQAAVLATRLRAMKAGFVFAARTRG